MKKSKLSHKLILFITPLVIAPLATLGVVAIGNTNEAAKTQTQSTISNFVDQQREKIENYLFAFGNTIDLLSNSPVLVELLSLPDSSSAYQKKRSDLIEVFSTYANSYPDLYSIELLTRDSENVVFYSNDLFAESKSSVVSSELAKIDTERKFLIRQKEATSATLHYLKKIRIADYDYETKTHWGFLLFNLQPTVLTASITETLSTNSINFVLAKDGQILFCSDFSLIGTYIPKAKLDLLREGLKNNELTEVSLESMNNAKNLFLGTQLEGDFYYFSGMNYEEMSKTSEQISMITALMVFISILVIPTLILTVVKKLLLNPIGQLADASYEVGAGNLTVKLVTDRNDEMGLLFNDFNQMINKILSYQLELKGYHQHLEDKVSDRTGELQDSNQRLEVAINEAKHANRLKSRFLANMSHEIRTPLTAIKGFTEHCLEETCTEANLKKYLGTVLRNSSHLIDLINNILDLSKIESEKLELERKLFSISELVFDLESVLYAQALNKKLKFSIEFEYPLPKEISSDITRLKQVLLNVCSNAIKFTKAGFARLTISYHEESNQIYFVVEDTGIGMTELEITRIFQPFEQADSSTTRRFGGTGLGLCISQNLAQILGGDIVVTSKPGEGSCFAISIEAGLPKDELDFAQSQIPLIEPPIQPAMPKVSIQFDADVLLAEDNPDNQQLIRILLEKRGIEVTIANNGEEAIEQALMGDFDLILMDMQMPIMGGLEATDVLRKAACDIPIIALTANVMKEDLHTYAESGCNTTIAKPIDQATLFRELAKYLPSSEGGKPYDESDDLTAQLHASSEFRQLVQTFLGNLPTAQQELGEAFEQSDWSQIGAIAHSIKGSAGSFGYPQLTEYAATLEYSSKQSSPVEIKHHLGVFDHECKRVLALNRKQVVGLA
jgi:signal transduction histidine kinase/CheY-like chemotaxis protein/HPt (histidine-containing phosphotransfer) domain-containing protein